MTEKKTAEEILHEHIDKESMDELSVNVWPDMLEAMEAYAAQQSKTPTRERLYKLAFKEACDMLVRTGWYKTNASAEGSILTLIKKRL